MDSLPEHVKEDIGKFVWMGHMNKLNDEFHHNYLWWDPEYSYPAHRWVATQSMPPRLRKILPTARVFKSDHPDGILRTYCVDTSNYNCDPGYVDSSYPYDWCPSD